METKKIRDPKSLCFLYFLKSPNKKSQQSQPHGSALMYGSFDSDSSTSVSRKDDEFVELKPEIIDFHRLHAREQELYFYDVFAFPWEKEKHYRMVYQLEKKYFPDQCLDKAFVDPDTEIPDNQAKNEKGIFLLAFILTV